MKQIVVLKDGPYLVKEALPLQIESIEPGSLGSSWTWRAGRTIAAEAPYALCRCGLSENKPFCDGTHAKAHFDGTETATHDPFAAQQQTIEGPRVDLQDAQPLCAFARFCDNAGGIWDGVPAADDEASVSLVRHEATNCPSGRLVLREKPSMLAIEPPLEAAIAIVEDPEKECSGPLWVKGEVEIVSADGTPYEVRNRQTLCRCGRSANKPFCDGTHADIAFRDGLVATLTS